jgi:hypothetical protein
MPKKSLIIFVLSFIAPVFMNSQCPADNNKQLIIHWQHTVCESKDPCDRCLKAPEQVILACEKLRSALAELDIQVIIIEQTEVDKGDYILLNQKPLEHYLNGKTVIRACASCLNTGNTQKEYNTLELKGTVYEIIPAALIIKAGLLAASELLDAQTPSPCPNKTTCPVCPEY